VKSVRYRFIKEFGKFELAEDKIHDTYVLVLEAIRKGNVTDPERFIGYIQTIARRKIIHGIRSIRADRRAPNLSECEQIVTSESAFESRLKKEQSHIIGQAVIRLRPLERELYQRLGQMQDEETICREMKLTSTQFRLAKSRGKQRLVRYVRELLGQESKPLPLVPKRLAATQILPATASVNPRD
jgi:DNA-directed RNA polymerase specialized sigma24 family protein